ncbi:Positive regulator of sigma(E), RseC/MucC [uncultured Sporomusa sp.]|uniref:Positive regulator of sigma(E), RseC/MucC n=1 Tax=uncultured Sporomusa sp. TaxID=307249 RepID=A0A212LTA3_9FIRM|nr:SoxR reducing system RseC family protein [uncultured Sporomusa sp.]SCM80726.1 Positive regulator of sigma(E), RseC/MucC [uncultured Sporomusa sp.]
MLEVIDDIAKVKASRHNDCENCGSCPGNNAIVLVARNPVGAKRGQRVVFEIEQISMLKSAIVVYAVPVLGTIAGAVVGWYFGTEVMGINDPFWLQMGGGTIASVLSLLYVRYYDRKARTRADMQPVITRIL